MRFSIVKRNIKDSVFTTLLSIPERRYLVYRAIHPEDETTTPEDLRPAEIKRALVYGKYNDCGFTVGDKLLILLEAQSTWSYNIVFRALYYLFLTYWFLIGKRKQNVFGKDAVRLPEAELYAVCTAKVKKRPKYLQFSKIHFNKPSSPWVDGRVRILYGDPDGRDIISQYVAFSQIFDDQLNARRAEVKAAELRAKKERRNVQEVFRDIGKEAVRETLRLCLERDILSEFLQERQFEIMIILEDDFVQEQITRAKEQEWLERGEKRGEKRGFDKGKKEGKEEGLGEANANCARKMLADGLPIAQIAKYTNLNPSAIRKLSKVA
ncbi:MAG: hypothetical protein IJM30_11785 [Thermoguttaceae bacterium]|nr:hypothetical protein [Thermoguttaceae bacterium]